MNKLSQFMYKPIENHWAVVKCLLCYLSGTRNCGVFLKHGSSLSLHAYNDSDWAGNQYDSTSTFAYIMYLDADPISWISKKQHIVLHSSTEIEYRSIASATSMLCWLYFLVFELRVAIPQISVIYYDNMWTTYICVNLVLHSKMKHIWVDFHFNHEKVASGELRVCHVFSQEQLANGLTKLLSRQ